MRLRERRKEIYILKPDTTEWLLLGEMITPRSRSVILNYGYQMMIIGGCDRSCFAELFTPAQGRTANYGNWVKQDGSFSEVRQVTSW